MIKPPKRPGKTPIGAIYFGDIFVDGGGTIIYLGKDGKWHVKRIPPWDPTLQDDPVLQEIGVVASLMALAQAVSDSPISHRLTDMAQAIIEEHGQQIMDALGAVEE